MTAGKICISADLERGVCARDTEKSIKNTILFADVQLVKQNAYLLLRFCENNGTILRKKGVIE